MSSTIHTPAPERKNSAVSYETLAGLSWAGGIPILIVMGIAAAIIGGRELCLGVCAGGCVIIFIHAGMYRSLKSVLTGAAEGAQKGGMAAVAGFLFRLILAGVLLAGCLFLGWVHPLGVAAGSSVILINNLFLAVLLATRNTHQELGSK